MLQAPACVRKTRYALWRTALRILLTAALFGLSGITAAQTGDTPPSEIDLYQQSVTSLRALFAANRNKHAVLQSLVQDANRLNAELQKCERDQERAVLRLESELDGLGDVVADESTLISEQRQSLKIEQAKAKSNLASCKVLLDETAVITSEIHERSRAIVRQHLFVPGTNLAEVATRNLADPSPWLAYTVGLGEQYRGLMALGGNSLLMLIAVMLVAMLCGWLLQGKLLRWGASRTDNELTSILLQSLKIALARYLPWLLASVAGSIFFLLVPAKPDDFRFWAYVTYSLTALLCLILAIRVLVYPLNQLPSPLLLPRELAQAMARRLRGLGLLCFIGVVYYASLQVLHLPVNARQFMRGIFLSLIVFNLLWLVWLVGQPRGEKPDRPINRRVRAVLALVLTSAMVAEWLGYRGLSTYLLLGVIGTTVLVTMTWILHVMLAESAHGLEHGKYTWQQRVRKAFGLGEKDTFPGLSTLRVLLTLALWSGFVLLLLKLWGVPDSFFQRLYLGFQNGFQIAGLHITPQRIVIGLLIFVVILQVVGRLKEWLEKRWLPASRMDRGAREASATVFGYLGFLVAVLIGLSATGLDLSKLALIAGALSVGIGFGLQNIVNNFVSGLILLFERPIVPGDYVGVDETEGYVRRISIRSTEIVTIDGRSIIVPNSDLISHRVTNWMRNDSFGRVRVEVTVSYGNNLKRIRELLLEIAEANPDVVNDKQARPTAECSGFGERGVTFVVMVSVRNFAQRTEVTSDLYIAIEAVFARDGINVPFAPHVITAAPTDKRQDESSAQPSIELPAE